MPQGRMTQRKVGCREPGVPGTPEGARGDLSGGASAVGCISEGRHPEPGPDADPEVDEGRGPPDLLLA